MPILFALVGATGIGKTDLSLELALRLDAEIVCVDSRQIYRGFSIGTAQPDKICLQRVKHHLADFLNPCETYSAGNFCRDVKELIENNPSKNYILVGGTGLYLQALILGLPEIPKIDSGIREQLVVDAEKNGINYLYGAARTIDPEATSNVCENNMQRIIRILEVWKGTGRKFSDWQKERVGGIGKMPIFWLQRDRDILYKRINVRVDQMMRDGWMEEIRGLAKTVPREAPAWLSLGYRELLQARTAEDAGSVLEEVKKKTRNYAKRQLTWFRTQMETIAVDLDNEKNPVEFIYNRMLVNGG
ncbi:MAG: tRNA (adenosine(37)-N6)-dimethylallyltransferase MiaA [Fibrobacter sp.]|nr:tRNA (adenosine(37)-N6)-dimethylallyltransferase MiaA [Fibrobacter sp.]